MSWYKNLKQNIENSIDPNKQDFITKVAGVTFENRQQIIRYLRKGQNISLVRDPANPHDSNAISVRTEMGESIGFLNRELAADLASRFDRLGHPVRGKTLDVTGGASGRSYGVNISFTVK